MALASKADHGAYRDARAIRGAAEEMVKAEVVELRAQCQVGQNAYINTATDAIGEIGNGASARSCRQMRATR